MEMTAVDAQNSCKHISHQAAFQETPLLLSRLQSRVLILLKQHILHSRREISHLLLNFKHKLGSQTKGFYCATSGVNFRNIEVFKPYSCTWVTLHT